MASELTLTEVSERLGLHYNTVYRYVRRGRLPATMIRGEWRVRPEDLDALGQNRAPGRRGEQGWDVHRARLLTRLVHGDIEGSWDVVVSCLDNGAEATEILTLLLGPTLAEIGEQWADGRLQVEDEHRATTAAMTVRGRLSPRFTRRGRRKGTVVVGTVPDDQHGMAVTLLADLLRGAGWAVVDLGADVPVDSWQRTVERTDDLVAAAIYIGAGPDDALRRVIESVRATVDPDVVIIVGGRGVVDEAHALELGADALGATTQLVVELVDGAPRHRTPPSPAAGT